MFPQMDRTRLIPLLLFLPLIAGCGSDSRRAALEAIRSAANPPEPPPDTVPEFLDYSADLQVDLSEMAKLPEGVLYRDLVAGSGIVAGSFVRSTGSSQPGTREPPA